MNRRPNSPSPNSLPDMIVFGISGSFEAAAPPNLKAITAALQARGATIRNQTNPALIRAALALKDDEGSVVGSAQIDLHFINQGAVVQLGDRSSIKFNALKYARELLKDEHECGEEGLGGSTNFIPAELAGPEMTDWILDIVQRTVSHVFDVTQGAVGAKFDRNAEMWLKAVEVCRDLPRSDAVADMHVLKGTMLEQTVGKKLDAYVTVTRGAYVNAAALLSLRFLAAKGTAVYKIYAKRRDILRLELACPDRKAVGTLAGRNRDQPSGENARQLVLTVMTAAEPFLELLQRHVENALTKETAPAELMIGLQDLIRLAAGIAGAKGPAPSPASIQHAKDALNGLLRDGWFSASGIPANLPVRRVLEKLCGPMGVLKRHIGRSVYCLHPRFASATRQMR